jgi:uncharacterized membrane protein YjgN (DUF898 family)
MAEMIEKRKKFIPTKDEVNILQWIFVKTLLPVATIAIISSALLFFGLEFLLRKVGFSNYGLTPTGTSHAVSQFITSYLMIACLNVILMVALAVVVIYSTLHTLVLPIMRITREVRQSIDTSSSKVITVRTSDRLLLPLVDLINELIQKKI